MKYKIITDKLRFFQKDDILHIQGRGYYTNNINEGCLEADMVENSPKFFIPVQFTSTDMSELEQVFKSISCGFWSVYYKKSDSVDMKKLLSDCIFIINKKLELL